MNHDSFQFGREYGPMFLIGSFLFLLACLVSHFAPQSEWYFYFAAMACGLQNGMTTKYSGSVVRTTHMTGASTDIGLTLGRLCKGDYAEVWKLQLLVPLLISFLVGGVASVPAFKSLGKDALLVNVVVFFSIGLCYSIVTGRRMHISVWRAYLGMYTAKMRRALRHISSKMKILHISQSLSKKQNTSNSFEKLDEEDDEDDLY